MLGGKKDYVSKIDVCQSLKKKQKYRASVV
jgi:hypothetical protein